MIIKFYLPFSNVQLLAGTLALACRVLFDKQEAVFQGKIALNDAFQMFSKAAELLIFTWMSSLPIRRYFLISLGESTEDPIIDIGEDVSDLKYYLDIDYVT